MAKNPEVNTTSIGSIEFGSVPGRRDPNSWTSAQATTHRTPPAITPARTSAGRADRKHTPIPTSAVTTTKLTSQPWMSRRTRIPGPRRRHRRLGQLDIWCSMAASVAPVPSGPGLPARIPGPATPRARPWRRRTPPTPARRSDRAARSPTPGPAGPPVHRPRRRTVQRPATRRASCSVAEEPPNASPKLHTTSPTGADQPGRTRPSAAGGDEEEESDPDLDPHGRRRRRHRVVVPDRHARVDQVLDPTGR